MRILGHLQDPQLKISFFRHENRLLLKFEDGLLEQTYKFREAEGLSTLQDLERLLDPTFLDQVRQRFALMRTDVQSLMERHFQSNDQEPLPHII